MTLNHIEKEIIARIDSEVIQGNLGPSKAESLTADILLIIRRTTTEKKKEAGKK